MPIKIRLKEVLKEKGMSQRQLARLVNVRPNTISHLCSPDVNAVYLKTLEQICNALDIELHQLLVNEKD